MANIFDIKLVFTQIPRFLEYLPMTLEITILSMIIGIVFGMVLAVFKIRRTPVLYRLTTIFVSFTRGTPLLVQLYITYFIHIPTPLVCMNIWDFAE